MKEYKPKKVSKTYLRNAALYYLSRFSSTEAHLEKILINKVRKRSQENTVSEEQRRWIAEVIADCARDGLVDDQSYANAKARSLHRKGWSIWRITAALRQKGVDEQKGLTAIEGLESINPDLEAAIIFARKRRLGPFSKNKSENTGPSALGQKAFAAFSRAGFAYDIAKKILRAANEDELFEMLEDDF